jgi:hypothetical protein
VSERKLAVLDVETTPIRGNERPTNLFWGLAIDGEDYRHFSSTDECNLYLAQREDSLTIYYHHDYEICQWLSDGVPIDIGFVRGGRVLSATSHDGKHEWRNSYAIFPSSLKEILESAGFAKPKLNCAKHEDVIHAAPKCKKCLAALFERNHADTVDALVAFQRLADILRDVTGMDVFSHLTIAGFAFKFAESVAGRLPEEFRFHNSYKGGRTEAFTLGDCGVVDCFDINSSYPFSFIDAPKRDLLVRATVTVKDERKAPGTPFWNKWNDKLMFPVGQFETWFYSSNYERYADRHKVVSDIQIHESVDVNLSWVCNVAPAVNALFARRAQAKKAGDNATAYCIKILLNAMYGRLGLKVDREIASVSPTVPNGSDVTYYRLPGGKYLSFSRQFVSAKANYPFAAFITDNARFRLFDGMASSTKRVHYCDTDSIYCAKGGGKHLNLGNGLGEWKHEATGKLYIHDCKDYEFVDSAGDGEVEIKRKGGSSSKEWTIRRVLSGQTVHEVEKQRRSHYSKRIVHDNGTTSPLVFPLPEE